MGDPESPDKEDILLLSTSHKAVAILLYSTLSVAAICGNLLIVLVIVYFRRLRTATNILILNLAVADVMIGVLCMPFSYWHVIIFSDQRWIFGEPFCKLFAFLQATAVFLSSWTLVAISFDRFMAIMFVMSPWLRLTRSRSLCLVAITWIFSVIMAAPLFYVNQMQRRPDGVKTCEEAGWATLEKRFGDGVMHSYGTLVFLLQYCLPLTVLVITYALIGVRIWNSHIPGDAVAARCGVNDRHESVKKMIRMVILVSALYAFCWLPQNLLINILVPYRPAIASHEYILYIWWVSNTIAMLHSVVNPFVYYSRNARFREGIGYFLRFLPCVKFSGFELLTEQRRMKAVRIVNMVAYMPVAGKKLADHSTALA